MSKQEYLLACLAEECAELIAEMLNKEAGMTIRMDDDAQDIKKKKVREYMEVSKICGTLKEGDE